MDSAFGRGARDLHLPGHAFHQECAFQTWCLLEELSLLSTSPLENVAFKKEVALLVTCCWFVSVLLLKGMILF